MYAHSRRTNHRWNSPGGAPRALVQAGDWKFWRNTSIEEAEDRGHHELLNWFLLAGAMSELGRKPDEAAFLETWVCNSNKVFAVFRPQ